MSEIINDLIYILEEIRRLEAKVTEILAKQGTPPPPSALPPPSPLLSPIPHPPTHPPPPMLQTRKAPEPVRAPARRDNQKTFALVNEKTVANPVSEVMDTWSSYMTLPRIQTITEKRVARVRVALANQYWMENWKAALQRLVKTPFCMGKNGWKADFDWFLEPTNIEKLLQGKYDNQKSAYEAIRDYTREHV